MRSVRRGTLGFFTDRPVPVRLPYFLSRAASNKSFVKFSGKGKAGSSGTAGQQ